MSLSVLFLVLLTTFIHQTNAYGEDCEQDPDCEAYALALTKAKYPSQSKVIKTLHSIYPSSPNSIFDSEGRVLLVNFGDIHNTSLVPGQKFKSRTRVWYSVFPDLQIACSQHDGPDKEKRIKQILGLPPNFDSNSITEVFAPISSIFRPCPDPEIYDEQCVVEIPVLNKKQNNHSEPWYCPHYGEAIHEVGEPYLKVQEAHLTWMCENWRKSYNNKETYKNFPWTALGYTYDWGTESGQGVSEYLVESNSDLIFHNSYSISEYCSSNNLNYLTTSS